MDYRNFLAGAGTGLITKTCVSPLERLKILYQTQGINNPNKYGSITNSLRTIVKEEGFRGLYKGNLVNCYRITPIYSLKFTFNEFYKSILIKDRKATFIDLLTVGALSGISQIGATYPLDLLRTRYALAETNQGIINYSRNVLKSEGIRGFYKGIPISMVTGSTHIGLQLSFYETYKSRIKNVNGLDNVGTKLLSGSLAGVCAQSITYPGDVLKKRMHTNGILGEKKHYINTYDCIKQIYNKEGMRGFYKGIRVSTLKTIPSAAIQFTVYDKLKKWLIE